MSQLLTSTPKSLTKSKAGTRIRIVCLWALIHRLKVYVSIDLAIGPASCPAGRDRASAQPSLGCVVSRPAPGSLPHMFSSLNATNAAC